MKEKHSFNRRIQKPREESHWRCGNIYRALSRIYLLYQDLKSGHCPVGAGHCPAGTFCEFLGFLGQSRTLSGYLAGGFYFGCMEKT
jgi:hypothetical protein